MHQNVDTTILHQRQLGVYSENTFTKTFGRFIAIGKVYYIFKWGGWISYRNFLLTYFMSDNRDHLFSVQVCSESSKNGTQIICIFQFRSSDITCCVHHLSIILKSCKIYFQR